MNGRVTVLITGAAGNLGDLLARRLLPTGHDLGLVFHRKPIPAGRRLPLWMIDSAAWLSERFGAIAGRKALKVLVKIG